MKLRQIVFLAVLGIFIFQSCVPSLHPLFTNDVLIYNKYLSGNWKQSDKGGKIKSESQWIFEANKDQSYNLVHFDANGKAAAFDAHLVQLGGESFLNLKSRLPSKAEKDKYAELNRDFFNELENIHYLNVNTFAKIKIESDQVVISFFDGDFLEKLLNENRIRIKHEKVEDGYLLTASSKELQKFVIKYKDNKDAFPHQVALEKN